MPETKQGIASAVDDTARELGSALGIAILGSVLNRHLGATTNQLVATAQHAFVTGISGSLMFAAGIVAASVDTEHDEACLRWQLVPTVDESDDALLGGYCRPRGPDGAASG